MEGFQRMIQIVVGMKIEIIMIMKERGGIEKKMKIKKIIGEIIKGLRQVKLIIMMVEIIKVKRLIVGK